MSIIMIFCKPVNHPDWFAKWQRTGQPPDWVMPEGGWCVPQTAKAGDIAFLYMVGVGIVAEFIVVDDEPEPHNDWNIQPEHKKTFRGAFCSTVELVHQFDTVATFAYLRSCYVPKEWGALDVQFRGYPNLNVTRRNPKAAAKLLELMREHTGRRFDREWLEKDRKQALSIAAQAVEKLNTGSDLKLIPKNRIRGYIELVRETCTTLSREISVHTTSWTEITALVVQLKQATAVLDAVADRRYCEQMQVESELAEDSALFGF